MLLILVAAAVLVAGGVPRLRWRRPPPEIDEVRFLAAIASELTGGASLRAALIDAAAGEDHPSLAAVAQLARHGAPLAMVAGALEGLPINGQRAATAIRVAGLSGGRSADVFLRLSDRAVEEAELRREKGALTTQVRLSALVVGGLPVVSLLFGGGGRVADLLALGTVGKSIAGLGLVMQTGGLVLVRMMVANR